MSNIIITLTEDQSKLILDMLKTKIDGLQYQVTKYTDCPTPEGAMDSGKYSSWAIYEFNALSDYKKRLAFAMRLQTKLIK